MMKEKRRAVLVEDFTRIYTFFFPFSMLLRGINCCRSIYITRYSLCCRNPGNKNKNTAKNLVKSQRQRRLQWGKRGACTGLGSMVALCCLKGWKGCCINRCVVSQILLVYRSLFVSGKGSWNQDLAWVGSKPSSWYQKFFAKRPYTFTFYGYFQRSEQM